MTSLINYIRANLANKSFEETKQHFETKNCRVFEDETTFMVVSPHDNEALDVVDAVGTILSKADNSIVCFGFPRTEDIAVDARVSFTDRLVATEYLGGTMIRAYYNAGKWRISTNGALDAYNNYWISPKSIGVLFDEILSKVYRMTTVFASSPLAKLLNPKYSYQFVLQHPEIHLEMAERPMIFHVGTFDNTELVYLDEERADRLPQPKIMVFDDFAHLAHEVRGMKSCFGLTFCEGRDHAYQSPRYKVLTKKFVRCQQLIGRTSNLYLRYLEAKEDGIDEELIQAFPSMRYYASWVDKSLFAIAKEVSQLYFEKYVKKNHSAPVNFYLRPIISAAHEKYQQTRIRVSVDSIMKQLHAEHPKRINFILNGLGKIDTNDVRLPVPEYPVSSQPVAKAPAPKAEEFPVLKQEPLTEEEILDANEAIELDLQDKPAFMFSADFSAEEFSGFLRYHFMPIIHAEMEIAWDANHPVFKGMEEQVFYRLSEMEYEDIMMCIEDQSMLIENVRELLQEMPFPDENDC